jgi:hypothetical protein
MASWSDSRAETQLRPALVCVECRAVAAGGALQWRAYLSYDGQVGIYCPDCAEREFGGGET